MEVTNYCVYDLHETLIASGLPMQDEYNANAFDLAAYGLAATEDLSETRPFQRMCKLVKNQLSSGHCNAFTGILVSMNVTATIKWWHQAERYHHFQIVSSQSTMHMLKKMLEKGTLRVHPSTQDFVVRELHEMSENADTSFEELAYSAPLGVELTARVATNYLQLMTMYKQRHNHKLQEWRDFCNMVKQLPYMEQFIKAMEEVKND